MSNRMNARLWSTLPEEFLDHIVAFLPFPALSRFRAVSKKYNAWIFSEEFIKLCAQLPLREAQVWMTSSKMGSGLVSTNFKVCAGAKLLGSTHEGMLPYFGPQWTRHMRAALGCLLFLDCTTRPADGSSPVHHELVLCDFSTMTCTRLPEPIVLPVLGYGYSHGCSHLMFEQCGEDRGEFKIAIMDLKYSDEDHYSGKPFSFQVYNSVMQSWKELHPEATCRFREGATINSTFICDRIFFLRRAGTLQNTCHHEIVEFDTITEKYKLAMSISIEGKCKSTKKKKKLWRPGFIIENYGKLASLKLIAANGRLHLTGWTGDMIFLVYEVDLPNKRLTRLTELPQCLMQDVTSTDVQVEGHRDCILLSSSKGGNVVYDCCRKTWRELRDCPLFGGGILSNFHFSMEIGNELDAGL